MAVLLLFACARQVAPDPSIATGERNAVVKAHEGVITGLVLDADDGHALSMVAVQAEQNGKLLAHDVSDYRGQYRLGPLKPGIYRITARFADARVVYEDLVVQAGVATESNLHVDLRPTQVGATQKMHRGDLGTIEGVVLEQTGDESFPGTVVSLSADHLDDAMMAIADEKGRFSFRWLRPGVYSLSCYYSLISQGDVELRRANVIVSPGETTAVQLRMDLKLR